MKATLKVLALFVGITLLVVPSGRAQEGKFTIKFSHIGQIDSVRHLTALKFKELVEKETNNRVVVEVYPSGQLYKPDQEGEALANGHIQMLNTAGGTPTKFVGEWEVFGLPTVWFSTPTNMDHTLAFEASEVCSKYITAKLEPKGIKFITFLPSCTSGGVSTAKKAVRKLEDFKGLKVHNPFGQAKFLFLKSLGATNLVIPQSELVMALSTGMVDGEYGMIENTLTQGYPVKYVHEWGGLMSGHGGACTLMNLAFWNSLPSDIQKIIMEKVVPELKAWDVAKVFEMEAKARETMKSRGVEFINLTPEMREQVRAIAAKPVLDWYAKKYPVSGPAILAEAARLDPRNKGKN